MLDRTRPQMQASRYLPQDVEGAAHVAPRLNQTPSIARINDPEYITPKNDPIATIQSVYGELLNAVDGEVDNDDKLRESVQKAEAEIRRTGSRRTRVKPSNGVAARQVSGKNTSADTTKNGGTKAAGKAGAKGASVGSYSAAAESSAATTAQTASTSSSKGVSVVGVKPLLMIAGVIAIIMLFILGLSMLLTSSFTATADPEDLTAAYEYITKLDAQLTRDIRNIPTQKPDVPLSKFFINGAEIDAEDVQIKTNADLILTFLACKADDMDFERVKPFIETIHAKLYSVALEIEDVIPVEESEQTETEESEDSADPVPCLFIRITSTPVSSVLYSDLTSDQLERFAAISSVGVYSAQTSLSRPCEGSYYISNRWGYQYTGTLEIHTGTDLAMPIGTEILAVMQGTVVQRSNSAITIATDSRRVIYKSLQVSASITEGMNVAAGEVIGTATKGNAADCTPDTLHMEYYIGDLQTNPAFFLPGVGNGSGDGKITSVALSQIGNIGGQPYWSWYGYNHHVNWCACFVSWCADQCGYIEAGIIPKTAYCPAAVYFFQQRGQWQPAGGQYIPVEGDIIFFDPNHNGDADHIGIVLSCDGHTVTTIEGNFGNAVVQNQYYLTDPDILGYATPDYNKGGQE